MSDVTNSRASPFAGLWPWPGNAFLALLAGWLLYMGSVAELADVKSAFYGLAGITGFLLLLGLRTLAGRSAHREADDRHEASTHEPWVGDEVEVEVVEEPDERAALALDRSREDAVRPIDARERFFRREREAVREGQESAATREGAPAEGDPGSLEALITRERAERGAQLARAEAEVRAVVTNLRNELLEQISRLEGELRATPEAGGSGASGEAPADAGSYVTKDVFNATINQRLLPRIEEMIVARITDAKELQALREEAASARELAERALQVAASGGAGAGEAEATPALAGQLRELWAGREADREALAALREKVDQLALTGSQRGGAKGIDGSVIQQRMNALKERIDRVAERADRGVAKTGRTMEDMRATVSAVTEHVSRMGEHYQDLMKRIEAIGAGLGRGKGEASVRADVDAMRDALTTIIEQNREIRAQQERLSAKFESPTQASLDGERT